MRVSEVPWLRFVSWLNFATIRFRSAPFRFTVRHDPGRGQRLQLPHRFGYRSGCGTDSALAAAQHAMTDTLGAEKVRS